MKNLVVERDAGVLLDVTCGTDLDDPVVDFCLGVDSKLYVATQGGAVLCVTTTEPFSVLWRQPLLPNLPPAPDTRSDAPALRITALTFVLELDALCIATSSGDIVLLHVEDQRVEAVGSIDGGVVALQWSPDGEVLALVSGWGSLLLMDKEWGPLAEVQLVGPPPGADTNGSPSRALAPVQLAPGDVQLSWRGDGKFFATVCPPFSGAAEPRVHVWDRNGCEAHATGEAVEGLMPLLAWQPNGRHMYSVTCSQQAVASAPGYQATGAGSHAVVLYERNGLRHGGFGLPGTGAPASLSWSCDSELLAILLAPEPKQPEAVPNTTADDRAQPAAPRCDEWALQVWHRSNWHWYLKHERRYTHLPGHPRDAAPCMRWDEQAPGLLHVVTAQGQYEQLGLTWGMAVSARGTAAVIDGRQLLLTPLQHGLVPPPMCAVSALLPEPAVDVAVGTLPAQGGGGGGSRDALDPCEDEVVAALTSGGRVAVLRSVEEDLWQETLEEQQEAAAAAGGHADRAALQPACPALDIPLAGGRRTRAVCWLAGSSSLLLLAAPYPEHNLEAGQGDVLVEVEVRWPAAGHGEVELQEGEPVHAGGRVLRLAPHAAGGACVELVDGSVWRFCAGAAALQPCGPRARLPAPCVRVAPAPAAALIKQDTPPLLGLSPQGCLYWGSTLVAGQVTSFTTRAAGPGGPALLYTTRTCLLYSVLFGQLQSGQYTHRELTAVAAGQKKVPQRHEGEVQAAMHTAMRPDAATAAARDVSVRAVEQGSALVSCPAGGVLAVLQMPRGNLEGVSPRALVLTAVALALERRDFAAAWRLATSQRVDLNLLVDLHWPAFLSHAAEFVAAVHRPQDLCDLLFALKPASCVAPGGLYACVPEMLAAARAAGGESSGSATAAAAGEGEGGGKVSAVCRAVRAAVEALPDAQRRAALSVVVSTFAKSDPPQLEDAIRCIRQAKEDELTASGGGGGGSLAANGTAPLGLAAPQPSAAAAAAALGQSTTSDKALKQLLLWVDADVVYRCALGMYELPLAYMVVVHAQKDPGEYLQQLQRFAAMSPPAMQRHAIDMHLGRYAKALEQLAAAGSHTFEQALALARERGLLRQALALYDGDSSLRTRVLDAYGDALLAAKRHEDAGVAYLGAGQREKALAAYRAAGRWRMVFVVAGQLEYDEQQVAELAAEVAEELAGSAQLADAAAVLLHYLQDVDSAVKAYADAKEWREAVRVALQHQRQDLVETVVAPAAASGAGVLLEDAREAFERIAKYLARLREVRAKRQAMQAALAAADEEGGGAGGAGDDVDMQSDAFSLVSGLSMYTEGTATGAPGTATSASRAPSTVGGRKPTQSNKRAKKGNRIRQGSPQEEAGLVELVLGLSPHAAQLEEAGQLAELLVLLGHMDDARTLQQAVARWQAAHQEARDDIARHPVAAEVSSRPHVVAGSKAGGAGAAEAVVWKWDILRAL